LTVSSASFTKDGNDFEFRPFLSRFSLHGLRTHGYVYAADDFGLGDVKHSFLPSAAPKGRRR